MLKMSINKYYTTFMFPPARGAKSEAYKSQLPSLFGFSIVKINKKAYAIVNYI